MYCMHCGKKMPDNAKFCPYCGKPKCEKMKSQTIKYAVEFENSINQDQYHAIETQKHDWIDQSIVYGQRQPDEIEKNSNTMMKIILSLVISAIILVGGYIIWKKQEMFVETKNSITEVENSLAETEKSTETEEPTEIDESENLVKLGLTSHISFNITGSDGNGLLKFYWSDEQWQSGDFTFVPNSEKSDELMVIWSDDDGTEHVGMWVLIAGPTKNLSIGDEIAFTAVANDEYYSEVGDYKKHGVDLDDTCMLYILTAKDFDNAN